MNIELKAKYLLGALDKPNKPGGPRGHGSYTARTGNTHMPARHTSKGTKHPIGFAGRTLSIRGSR